MDILVMLAGIRSMGENFLSETGRHILSQQVIITGIILWFLNSHFKKIEDRLLSVTDSIKSLTETLANVENSHSKRLISLEQRMTLVEQKTTPRKAEI